MRIVRPVGAMCPLSSLLRMKGRRPTDDERGVWVLEDPVVFKVDGYVHNIRAGALTDLASAPWFMRWLIEPEDWPWVTPAVIHDHAYAGLAATRAQADRWWRQAVIAVGGDSGRAWLTWAGLRAGGWLAWRRNRRQRRLSGPAPEGSDWRYLP